MNKLAGSIAFLYSIARGRKGICGKSSKDSWGLLCKNELLDEGLFEANAYSRGGLFIRLILSSRVSIKTA